MTTSYDTVRKIDLAIKRIRPYANDEWDARHTLREIRLLKLLGNHPNVFSFDYCSFSFNCSDFSICSLDYYFVRIKSIRTKDGIIHDDGIDGLRFA